MPPKSDACDRCGRKLRKAVRFCPSCGRDLAAPTNGEAGSGSPTGPAAADSTRRRASRWWLTPVLIVGTGALIAVGITVGGSDTPAGPGADGPATTSTTPRPESVFVDGGSPTDGVLAEVTTTAEGGGCPGGLAVTATRVWLADCALGLVEIDAESGEVLAVQDLGASPSDVAVMDDTMWVSDSSGAAVYRLRITDKGAELAGTTAMSHDPYQIVAGPEGVWTGTSARYGLTRIDPIGDRVLHSNPGVSISDLALGRGHLWVLESDGDVVRIDPDTDEVVGRNRVQASGGQIAFAFDALWVSAGGDGSLRRVDPASLEITDQIEVGEPGAMAFSLAADRDGIWVANSEEGTLTLIDPESVTQVTTVPVGRFPRLVSAGEDSVWVTVGRPPSVVRVEVID